MHEKEIKGIEIRREEIKHFLSATDINIYVEKSQTVSKNPSKCYNKF